MNPATHDVHVSGHCYCGGITFDVYIAAGEAPIFSAYCHCDSCRRAHAAPLYHVVCLEEHMFTLTSGQDLLVEFNHPGRGPVRAFCGTCGSKVLNRFGSWKPGGRTPLAFFPNLLDETVQQDLPTVFRPAKTNRGEECVLDAERLADVFGG